MFFLKNLTHRILLHPHFFGAQLHECLRQKLHAEVQGQCTGRYGYIIAVADIEDLGSGQVMEGTGTGMAEYNVKYRAIVFKPFKGEVLDAQVTTVNKVHFWIIDILITPTTDGILLRCRPVDHIHLQPCELPSLKCHSADFKLIPDDLAFDSNANPPCYQTADQTLKIEKGEWVRVKIVGTRVDATEIFAIGSVKEDYLGLLDNA